MRIGTDSVLERPYPARPNLCRFRRNTDRGSRLEKGRPISPKTSCPPLAQDTYQRQVDTLRREQLILRHIDLVRHVVGRMVAQLPAGCDSENLESAGMLGLVEAAQHYEPERGAAFSTYAYPRIRGAVLDELRRNSPLPQRVLRNIGQLREIWDQHGHALTPEQLSERTGLTLDEIEETLEALRISRIQQTASEAEWLHALHDGRAAGPADALEQKELKQALAEAIEQLPQRERHVLVLYYLEDLRLKEIGAVVNLSESRVSRLLSRAESRLQAILRSRMEEPAAC